MADLPDRLPLVPLILGSASFDADFDVRLVGGSYDAATSTDWLAGGNKGSTNTPGPAKDSHDLFDTYFDYPRYREDITDATTQSDIFSEGNSLASPSVDTAASSVGGPAYDAEEDITMTDYTAAPGPHDRFRDVLPWPQEFNDIPPYNQSLHDEFAPNFEAPGVSLLAPQNTGHLRPPSRVRDPAPITAANPNTTSAAARKRMLEKPDETRKVREMGACTHCRIARVRCEPTKGVCPACEKVCKKWQGPGAEKICNRKTPHEIVGSLASRWCWNEAGLHFPSSSSQFTNERVRVCISFREHPNSPYLEVDACCFDHRGQRWLGIVPNRDPDLDRKMYDWAKKQIQSEGGGEFGSCAEKFLMAYVNRDGLGQAVRLETKYFDDRSNFVDGQKVCVDRLLSMRCMWRVWCCRQFYVRRASDKGLPFSPLSPRQQPIQDYLHQHAGEAISEHEKAALKEVDKLLSPIDIRKGSQPLLWSALKVSVWVSLWQLILIYRDTLGQRFYGQQMNTAPIPINGGLVNSKRHQFHMTTEELYHSVVVLYSEVFRNKGALQGLGDAGTDAGVKVFGNDRALHQAFQGAWQARCSFYLNFQQITPGDELVKALIVGKEEKALSGKRGGRR